MNPLMDKLIKVAADTADADVILAVGIGLQLARESITAHPEQFKECFGQVGFDAVTKLME